MSEHVQIAALVRLHRFVGANAVGSSCGDIAGLCDWRGDIDQWADHIANIIATQLQANRDGRWDTWTGDGVGP